MTISLLPCRAARRNRFAVAALVATLGLTGCASTDPTAPITRPVAGQLSNATPEPSATPARIPVASNAVDARAYRRDAARHIYEANGPRIYTGMLPPVLYAIGTLQVNLDARGKVVSMHWMRAPKHAPEVIAEIERTVLAASPFPAATRLGTVTWTDTWLWDKSERFQLDTLSEGQRSE